MITGRKLTCVYDKTSLYTRKYDTRNNLYTFYVSTHGSGVSCN